MRVYEIDYPYIYYNLGIDILDNCEPEHLPGMPDHSPGLPDHSMPQLEYTVANSGCNIPRPRSRASARSFESYDST